MKNRLVAMLAVAGMLATLGMASPVLASTHPFASTVCNGTDEGTTPFGSFPGSAGNELRFMSLDQEFGSCSVAVGSLAGFDIFNGTESWVFDSTSGFLQDVTGTPLNPGGLDGPDSAAPVAGTHSTLNQVFNGLTGTIPPDFPSNFLAPTETNAAGLKYGPAVITLNPGPAYGFSINFPTLEMQIGGTTTGGIYLPLSNVTFACSTFGALILPFVNTFYACTGEHLVTASEVPMPLSGPPILGYENIVLQWEMYGTATSGSVILNFNADDTIVPVPAAIWLFVSGLLGLVGTARCRRS